MRGEALRALVLAAGRGERLRPLTDRTPKPLLPVLGASILERTLGWLAAAGVERTAVNLFHLGEEIPHQVGDEVGGMALSYWPETELLGTLGPLGRLGSFFEGSDPVLMLNGDSLCRWPVEALIRAHRTSGAEATLLLSSRADIDSFGGGVSVDAAGRIVSFRGGGAGGRRGVFAGFHAIAPELLGSVDATPSDIVRDLYEPALARGALIRGVFTRRRWHDLGTPRRYLEGVLGEARAVGTLWAGGRMWADGWIHPAAQIEGGTEFANCVLEEGVLVETGAHIEASLIMPGAVVGARSRVSDSIIGPGVELPADSSLGGRLVTQTATDYI